MRKLIAAVHPPQHGRECGSGSVKKKGNEVGRHATDNGGMSRDRQDGVCQEQKSPLQAGLAFVKAGYSVSNQPFGCIVALGGAEIGLTCVLLG